MNIEIILNIDIKIDLLAGQLAVLLFLEWMH